MKKIATILLTLLLTCCSGTVEESDLALLNGYWEITKVTFANGEQKEYKISPTVDFIELNNLKGFRKKVNPKFDGSFETSDDAEPFTITKQGDAFYITYKNNLSTWKETIIAIKAKTFSVKNIAGTQYHYKRFEPINITP